MENNGGNIPSINNKTLVVPLIILSAVVLFMIFVKTRHAEGPRKTPESVTGAANPENSPENSMVNGYYWNRISGLAIPAPDKTQIKASLIKIALETSIINGRPLIEPKGPLLEYTAHIDKFYENTDNLSIPVFFGIKAADMINDNAPVIAVQSYCKMVLQKLTALGLLQPDSAAKWRPQD